VHSVVAFLFVPAAAAAVCLHRAPHALSTHIIIIVFPTIMLYQFEGTRNSGFLYYNIVIFFWGGGRRNGPSSLDDDPATMFSSGYFIFPPRRFQLSRAPPPFSFFFCANFVPKPAAVCRCICRYSLVLFLFYYNTI